MSDTIVSRNLNTSLKVKKRQKMKITGRYGKAMTFKIMNRVSVKHIVWEKAPRKGKQQEKEPHVHGGTHVWLVRFRLPSP